MKNSVFVTRSKQFSIAISFMLLLASCSVQKRHYMQGYNLEWKTGKQGIQLKQAGEQAQKTEGNRKPETGERLPMEESVITASSKKAIELPKKIKKIEIPSSSQPARKKVPLKLTALIEKHPSKSGTNGDDPQLKKEKKYNNMAVVSFLLGGFTWICAIAFFLAFALESLPLVIVVFALGVVSGILAAVIGVVSFRNCSKDRLVYKVLAALGVLSSILLFGIFILILLSLVR